MHGEYSHVSFSETFLINFISIMVCMFTQSFHYMMDDPIPKILQTALAIFGSALAIFGSALAIFGSALAIFGSALAIFGSALLFLFV
jgi:hypothetical protein